MATNAPAQTPIQLGNDIRDIQPPMSIPNYWLWLWCGLGVLTLAIAGYLLWRYWQKRRKQVSVTPPVPVDVRARQKLQEALALIHQPKPFCTAVSDAIRAYLEERFEFHAPDRTTEEFLHELRGTNLLYPDQKESLG